MEEFSICWLLADDRLPSPGLLALDNEDDDVDAVVEDDGVVVVDDEDGVKDVEPLLESVDFSIFFCYIFFLTKIVHS